MFLSVMPRSGPIVKLDEKEKERGISYEEAEASDVGKRSGDGDAGERELV